MIERQRFLRPGMTSSPWYKSKDMFQVSFNHEPYYLQKRAKITDQRLISPNTSTATCVHTDRTIMHFQILLAFASVAVAAFPGGPLIKLSTY